MGRRKSALILIGCVPWLVSLAPPSTQEFTGSGTLCDWAILLAIDEVGRQCTLSRQDRDLKRALADGVRTLGRHARDSGSMTDEAIQAFERQMRNAEEPTLCSGDGVGMYKMMRRGGARNVRETVARSIAKPLPLRFGSCL